MPSSTLTDDLTRSPGHLPASNPAARILQRPGRHARWQTRWLQAAGVYNLAWGLFVILQPQFLFEIAGVPRINYPPIWQCVGMIVGVYGVGYLIAARDPAHHWPIVFIGLLGKVLGPIGFAVACARGDLPALFGLTILSNDLIWWLPFAVILWQAARTHQSRRSNDPAADLPVKV